MEYYNNILCVTYAELTEGDDAVISAATLRQNMRRGNIQCARQGKGEGNYALYVYASLPEKYRMKYEERHGDPSAVLRQHKAEPYEVMDSKARAYYEAFE